MTFIVDTLARDDSRAVKLQLLYDAEPTGDELADARANASACFRRRYQEWCGTFSQTITDRATGRSWNPYPSST